MVHLVEANFCEIEFLCRIFFQKHVLKQSQKSIDQYKQKPHDPYTMQL